MPATLASASGGEDSGVGEAPRRRRFVPKDPMQRRIDASRRALERKARREAEVAADGDATDLATGYVEAAERKKRPGSATGANRGGGAGTGGSRGRGGDASVSGLGDHRWVCESCTLMNSGATQECAACGEKRRPEQGPAEGSVAQPGLTLAQRLGLVPKPSPLMTTEQWKDVSHTTEARLAADEGGGTCAICLESLGLAEQVLLSCSHVFHADCLASFERFMRVSERTCPMCRRANYEKRRTRVGAKRHVHDCALRLQSLYRGHRTRVRYYALRKELYASGGGDPTRRRLFFADRMTEISTKLDDALAEEDDELDRLFAQLDRDVEASREAFRAHGRAFAQKPTITEDNVVVGPGPEVSAGEWAEAERRAVERAVTECPICIASFTSKARETVLLSCSHVFHGACIAAFESFNVYEKPQCPVCRAEYRKKVC